MDRRFLETIVESYLLENNVFKTANKKEISNLKIKLLEELNYIINILKEENLELYTELYKHSKGFQKKIIYEYFDSRYNNNEVLLEGPFLVGAILALIGMIAISGSSMASKFVMKTAERLGALSVSFGKILISYGRYFTFSYAIIQKNTELCYTKCNFSKERADLFDYLSTATSAIPLSKETIEKIDCLRECYINSIIQVISLFFKNYFICLKQNKSFDDISRMSGDDLFKSINLPSLAPACLEYYNKAIDVIQYFNDLLNFCYADDDKEKQNKYRALTTSLIRTRDDVSRIHDFKNYQK